MSDLFNKCDGLTADCEGMQECMWDESNECVEPVTLDDYNYVVAPKSSCTVISDVMMWRIAEATGDSNIGELATVMNTERFCKAAKETSPSRNLNEPSPMDPRQDVLDGFCAQALSKATFS